MDQFAKTLKQASDLVSYLTFEYKVSEPRVQQILEKQKVTVEKGISNAHFIWWVGDELAELEGLELKDEVHDED